jgi:hypothetical protein
MYQTLTINRETGALTALNTREAESDKYVAFCVNRSSGVALNQPDYNEMTNDLDEALQVLSTKVQRMLAARERGVVGTPFEALVRDVNIMAQRVFEKTIGRKSAA